MAEQHRMDNGSGWPGASRPGMPPQSGMGRMQGAPGNRPPAPPYGAGFVRPEQPRYDEMRMHPLQQPQQGNGIGTAGFVLSIVGVCFGFVPFVGVVCWILRIVFCNRPWKASARTGHRRIGNISCIAVDIDCGLCRHFCNRFCG